MDYFCKQLEKVLSELRRRDFLKRSASVLSTVSPIGKLALSLGGGPADAVTTWLKLPEKTKEIVRLLTNEAATWGKNLALSRLTGSLQDKFLKYPLKKTNWTYDEDGEPHSPVTEVVEVLQIPSNAFAGHLLDELSKNTSIIDIAASEDLMGLGGEPVRQIAKHLLSTNAKEQFNEYCNKHLKDTRTPGQPQHDDQYADSSQIVMNMWGALLNIDSINVPAVFSKHAFDSTKASSLIDWMMRNKLVDISIGKSLLARLPHSWTRRKPKPKKQKSTADPETAHRPGWDPEPEANSMHQYYESVLNKIFAI